MPACIYGNKKIINTRDGSYTFYSMEYNESYKTKSVGAYTESLHKFVNGTNIIERAREKNIRLLDICFGIGLNLAVTFDEALKNGITNRIHALSVEKDASLISIVKNTHILMPVNGYKVVRSLLDNNYVDNFSMEIYIQDAVNFIYSLNHKFDVIYFDPCYRYYILLLYGFYSILIIH